MSLEAEKKSAGEKALEFIEDGMVVGLGTGSTAEYFIRALAAAGRKVTCVSTSRRTEDLALRLGLKTVSLDSVESVDVDVDGADEIDPDFNLIKGGGGAHTQEKKVAKKSKVFAVIADHTKLVPRLGKFPVAVEADPERKDFVATQLASLGGKPKLRENFLTDGKNIIFDTSFTIDDPLSLEKSINRIEGVVENGLFSERKPEVVVLGEGVKTKILSR